MRKGRASKGAILKAMARRYTAFEAVTITEQMRTDHKHLAHCSAIFSNSRYEVQIFPVGTSIGGVQQMTCIRHGDIEPISWGELQRVKNDIFGSEATAVEVYPPMAEEWNTRAGVRILWILPNTWELPFGLTKPGAWGKPE